MKTCSICGEEFTEFGNNAWPVNDGRCCNKCDDLEVIPKRLMAYGYPEDKAKELGKDLHEMRRRLLENK